ncbi:MAG: GTP-binding protein [Fibrobacterales bacterium]
MTQIDDKKAQLNVVIAGHVDHGKSTIIGRLLADTNSLPDGKIEQIRANCERDSKPFEYAFLLDALKDEQSQGITIDVARCFFNTDKRNYIILDAPGHIEFLKNMVTGAARAEAAFVVIDAKEGIQENSKRHGYLMSMLGIKQIVVLVNKIDLVDYSEDVFESIKAEYIDFLKRFNISEATFVPVSGMEGVNISSHSEKTPWYTGKTVLDQLDSFDNKAVSKDEAFRFPVQDIYKFTRNNDDRRIIAGTVETGTVTVGDKVTFYPSGKSTHIKSIEMFNAPIRTTAQADDAIGFQMTDQIYIKPGELMVKEHDKAPLVGRKFQANIFWLARQSMEFNKEYKLKIGTASHQVRLTSIINAIDATENAGDAGVKSAIERHDIATVEFESTTAVAFDLVTEVEQTGRFVLVDNYEISGGGVILEKIEDDDGESANATEDFEWHRTALSKTERKNKNGHAAAAIVLTTPAGKDTDSVGYAVERALFEKGIQVTYLGMQFDNSEDKFVSHIERIRAEYINKIYRYAQFAIESGTVFVTVIPNAENYEIELIKEKINTDDLLIVNIGDALMSENPLTVQISAGLSIEATTVEVLKVIEDKRILE